MAYEVVLDLITPQRARVVPSKDVVPLASEHRPIWYRGLERVAALGALAVFLLPMLVVAGLIRLDSRGPALFTQTRLTRGGRPFTFVKFRTMAVDGNQRFPEFAPSAWKNEPTSTLRLQVADDPRVTRLGQWLRRSSIDELPNLLHVLTGSMALVGPRPEMPEALVHYSDEQLVKFSVTPGITGYAQIYGRGDLSFLETVEQDLRYVRDRSFRVDVGVLIRTVQCVLARKGAR